MVPWANPNPQPKRQLNQMSHFGRDHYCNRPRQQCVPDHTTVTAGHIYVRSTTMRPNNNNYYYYWYYC